MRAMLQNVTRSNASRLPLDDRDRIYKTKKQTALGPRAHIYEPM